VPRHVSLDITATTASERGRPNARLRRYFAILGYIYTKRGPTTYLEQELYVVLRRELTLDVIFISAFNHMRAIKTVLLTCSLSLTYLLYHYSADTPICTSNNS
jgi:hypothetical protein